MGHVDDAHLAEDDGKPERHQHVDGEQDQSGKALHREDGAEIAERIVAEHLIVLPVQVGPRGPRRIGARGIGERGR